jgi:hypothetical protein
MTPPALLVARKRLFLGTLLTCESLKLVLRVFAYVADADDATGQNGAMSAAGATRSRRVRITIGGGTFHRHLMKRNQMDQLTVEPEDGTQRGVTEMERSGRDGLADRLSVGGRDGNHAKDFAGGRLLFRRLA